ncbi:hypothetical protein TSOC_006900 [Tetrabaena socialis]|uniref:Uncharacterized protein n=1 Tax=Tetrabaena socialis TaxID=47790 RepID=A0A2J8A2E0_9CHLO|nr:hypothetical protein TSOC_006900 [Tetrabaena socialis]|eukprot:PNH06684.1 hypothetical protein TSOC_006900 [Tetrabaena socialis]
MLGTSPVAQLGIPPLASQAVPCLLASCFVPSVFDRLNCCRWQVEDMLGIPRVMGDATSLPTGKVTLHGGAQKGKANASPTSSSTPNSMSLMYSPENAEGERYEKYSFGPIARVYHAAACLDISGKILLAGSETSYGNETTLPPGMSPSLTAPLEYRLEFAVPREIGPGSNRPIILSAPASIIPDRVFNVKFLYTGGPLYGASIVAPCASTHSLNINQRVIILEIVQTLPGGFVQIAAPPADLFGKAALGYYMLFLLGQGGTYSEGVWLQMVPP